MEFPILKKIKLPDTCLLKLKHFLREPHPTAKLISALVFERRGAGSQPFVGKPKLVVSGPGIRYKDRCCQTWWNWDGILIPGLRPPEWVFAYDKVTGECLVHWNSDKEGYDTDDDVDTQFLEISVRRD